uniref:Uncharacterized protein n=1 Tax=Aegilops tauschii subsp. strangulata TaxID=200361 RepID=A0A453BLU6_AEGTS
MSSKRYKLQFQGNLSQILFRFRAGGEGRTSGCMMETMMHGRTGYAFAFQLFFLVDDSTFAPLGCRLI